MKLYTFRSLPLGYLDECLRNLEPNRRYNARCTRWRRIPLDLLPLRSEQLDHDGGTRCRWYVIPAELAVAICEGLGEHDCGREGDEPFARWLKSRIAIKKHAGRMSS